jgi:uncharacterized protein (DUF2249 family)
MAQRLESGGFLAVQNDHKPSHAAIATDSKYPDAIRMSAVGREFQ